MKRTLLVTFALFLLVSNICAQVQKGTALLGGNFAISSLKQENAPEASNISILLNPSFGTAIKENLILGIDLHFSKFRNGKKEDPSHEFVSHGVGFFLRKYYPIAKNFFILGQGGVGHIYTETKNRMNNTDYKIDKTNSVRLYVYPGISYAICKSVHLEAGLSNILNINYSKSLSGTEYNSIPSSDFHETTEFNLRTSLPDPSRISIGIRFLINK